VRYRAGFICRLRGDKFELRVALLAISEPPAEVFGER